MNILQQLTENDTIEPQGEQEPELEMDNVEEDTEVDISDVQQEGGSLYCSHCDWKTHSNAKNKERGLKDHIRKNHPDEYKTEYGKQNKKKYTKKNTKTKSTEIILAPPKIAEEYDKIEDKLDGLDEDEIRQKLLGDLDLLQTKFSSIEFKWNYNSTSSLKQLRRQKALFLRVLNDTASTQAVFNLLVVASKGIERIGGISGLADIEGYSSDIKDNRDEIYPILENMVDSGTLDVSHLTPELRLGMIMASTLVGRLEKNRIGLNGQEGDAEDGEYV